MGEGLLTRAAPASQHQNYRTAVERPANHRASIQADRRRPPLGTKSGRYRHRRRPVGPSDLGHRMDERQPVVQRDVPVAGARRHAGLRRRTGRAIAPVVVAHHLLHGRHEPLRADPEVLERQDAETVCLQLQLPHLLAVVRLHRRPVLVPVVVVAHFVRHQRGELIRAEQAKRLRGDEHDGAVVEADEGRIHVDHPDRDGAGAGAIIQNPLSC